MPSQLIGAVGSLLGAGEQASAASDAADQQAAAARDANATQLEMYNQTRNDSLPFLNTGVAANRQLAYLMGINPANIDAEQGKTTSSGTSYNPYTSTPAYTGNFNPAFVTSPTNVPPGLNTIQAWAAASGYKPTAIATNPELFDLYQQYLQNGGSSQNLAQPMVTANTSPAVTGATPTYTDPTQAAAASGVNTSMGTYGSLAAPFSASAFQVDPGYQFALDQGNLALQRSQAAKGGLLSGAAVKQAETYNQGMANQQYQQAYDRYNANQTNLFNRLSSLSGGGQTSANTLASAGQNTANQISNNTTSAGAAQAAGTVGAANAWSTGLNNIASSYGGYGNSANPISSFDPSAYANGLPWSDIRLKENIVHLGTENGHNIYEFNYIWSPKLYIGVMAHEVPHAAMLRDGFLCVDYSKLGVEFREAAQWH